MKGKKWPSRRLSPARSSSQGNPKQQLTEVSKEPATVLNSVSMDTIAMTTLAKPRGRPARKSVGDLSTRINKQILGVLNKSLPSSSVQAEAGSRSEKRSRSGPRSGLRSRSCAAAGSRQQLDGNASTRDDDVGLTTEDNVSGNSQKDVVFSSEIIEITEGDKKAVQTKKKTDRLQKRQSFFRQSVLNNQVNKDPARATETATAADDVREIVTAVDDVTAMSPHIATMTSTPKDTNRRGRRGKPQGCVNVHIDCGQTGDPDTADPVKVEPSKIRANISDITEKSPGKKGTRRTRGRLDVKQVPDVDEGARNDEKPSQEEAARRETSSVTAEGGATGVLEEDSSVVSVEVDQNVKKRRGQAANSRSSVGNGHQRAGGTETDEVTSDLDVSQILGGRSNERQAKKAGKTYAMRKRTEADISMMSADISMMSAEGSPEISVTRRKGRPVKNRNNLEVQSDRQASREAGNCDLSVRSAADLSVRSAADLSVISAADVSVVSAADVSVMSAADVSVMSAADVSVMSAADTSVMSAADDSVMSEAPLAKQVKRRKGRPKKIRTGLGSNTDIPVNLSDGLTHSQIDDNDISVMSAGEINKTSECDVSIMTELGTSDMPVKKKRGRPFKRKIIPEEGQTNDKNTKKVKNEINTIEGVHEDNKEGCLQADGDDVMAQNAAGHVTSWDVENKTGRRRSGRTKPAAPPKPSDWSESDVDESDDSTQDRDYIRPKPTAKKREGPPRKALTQGTKSRQQAEAEEQDDYEPRASVRKPGRPPGRPPKRSSFTCYKKYEKWLAEAAGDTQEQDSACCHCQEICLSKAALSHHMLTKHHRVFSLSHPEGEYAPKAVIKRLGEINCLQCGKSFRFFHYFKYHCQWCGREDELAECETCQHQVKAMWLHAHVQEHKLKERKAAKRLEEEAKAEKEAEEGEKNNCGRVKRKAASRAMDNLHQSMEEMEKVKTWISSLPQQVKYQVPGRVVPPQLLSKVKAKIKDNGKATCPYKGCKKKSQYLTNLHFHMRTCALGPEYSKEYRCKSCDKTFPEEDQIITHCKEHGDEEVKGHQSDSEASDPGDRNADVGDDDWSGADKDSTKASESEMETPDEEEMNEDMCIGTKVYTHQNSFAHPKRRYYGRKVDRSGPLDVQDAKLQASLGWRQKNEAQELLFPDWMPSQSNWVRLSQREHQSYLPTEEVSIPYVSVNTVLKGEQLDLKTPTDVESSTLHRFGASAKIDEATFYVGGPVWSLAWCPVPHKVMETDQYVAVYCHREPDRLSRINKPSRQAPSLIQIWNCGPLHYGPSTPDPKMVLAIAVDCGAIWEMKWCPTGAYQAFQPGSKDAANTDKVMSGSNVKPGSRKSGVTEESGVLQRLGLLACGCEDGSIKIYSIPHPDALTGETDQGLPIYRVKPSAVLVMEVTDPVTSDPVTPDPVTPNPVTSRIAHCLCIDWSWKDSCSIVAAGFSDGKIALWDITTTSPFLRHQSQPCLQPPSSQSEGVLLLLPYHFWHAHSKCVKALAIHQSSGHILASTSLDRQLYLWDLSDLAVPIQTHARSAGTTMHWPLQGVGPFVGYDDCFQIEHNSVHVCDFVQLHGGVKSAIRHNDAILSCSYSDWLHTVASCDFSGAALGMTLTPDERMHLDKSFARRRFVICVNTVENVPHTASVNKDSDDNKSEIITVEKSDRNVQQGVDEQKNRGETPKSNGLTEERTSIPCLVMHEGSLSMPTPLCAAYKDLPWQDLTKPDTRALHQICWSPNLSSHLWLVYGGCSGLIRLRKMSGLLTHTAERTISKLKTQAPAEQTNRQTEEAR